MDMVYCHWVSGWQGDHAMERTIARLNIERYKRLLESETDETKKQMLTCLLAEEEMNLRNITEPMTRNGSA
jgi:hypothetical protein